MDWVRQGRLSLRGRISATPTFLSLLFFWLIRVSKYSSMFLNSLSFENYRVKNQPAPRCVRGRLLARDGGRGGAVWGGSPRLRLGEGPPPWQKGLPPPRRAGPTLLLAWVAPGSDNANTQCIHYNSITVIKAGGMQRQEGVLPTGYTPCHQREITAADAARSPSPAICSARGPPEGRGAGGPRGRAAQDR